MHHLTPPLAQRSQLKSHGESARSHHADTTAKLKAWAQSGLKKPIEEIFVRVSDNGSNMIKGWEQGFQVA